MCSNSVVDIVESTIRYLNARISKFEEREKLVSIVMDEIYTSKRAEYSRTSEESRVF